MQPLDYKDLYTAIYNIYFWKEKYEKALWSLIWAPGYLCLDPEILYLSSQAYCI